MTATADRVTLADLEPAPVPAPTERDEVSRAEFEGEFRTSGGKLLRVKRTQRAATWCMQYNC